MNSNTQQHRLAEINARFAQHHPDDILCGVWRIFREKVVLGTGFGPSGIFLVHRLFELKLPVRVFFLDTHLLFDETYQLKEELEDRFQLQIEAVKPALNLKEQAAKYGDKLWKRNPNRCCHHRKVLPLRNYLSGKKAWISGVRRSQSVTRQKTQVFEWDPSNCVIKINPLASWNSENVWDYIHEHQLPYNPLHDEGFPSIGCIPCTDKVNPDEKNERAGRWKDSGKTECGIHLPAQNFTDMG